MPHHPFIVFADGRSSEQQDAGMVIHLDHVVAVRPLDAGNTAIDLVDGQLVTIPRRWESVLEDLATHPRWTSPQGVQWVEPEPEPQRQSPWMPLVMHLVEAASAWMASTSEGEALSAHVSELLGVRVSVEAPVTVLPPATEADRQAVDDGRLGPNGWAPSPADELDDDQVANASWVHRDNAWALCLVHDPTGVPAVWLAGRTVHLPPFVIEDLGLQVGELVVWDAAGEGEWVPRTTPDLRDYPEDPDTTGDGLG